MPKLRIGDGAIDRISDKVANRLRPQYPGGVPNRDGRIAPTVVTCKITAAGASPGYYQATEQIWDDSAGQWIDLPGGRSFTTGGIGELFEINGDSGVQPDTIVAARGIGGDEGGTHWVFTIGGAAAHLMEITASTDYNTYTASRYGDGWNQAATETGLTLEIGQIATGETIPNGTRLIAVKVGATYYGQVPVWL